MATTPIKLKLFVNQSSNKVEFAECESDFVDVLLSFLTMPIGTIIHLTDKEPKIGGMSTLYESVKDLDVGQACKEMLLHPENASKEHCKKLKVNIDENPSSRDCCAKSDGGVFVKGSKKFIIRDDLRVFPSDSEEAKKFIKKLAVRDGREVKVGKAEVLQLLKRSLLSETPLTDVFGRKRRIVNNCCDPDEVSVKLTVNKSKNKVVYAEGGEEFADLLFSFLAFPQGFVAKFFGGDSGIKCLDNLYRSALKKFIESKECEGLLVDPKLGPYFCCKNTIIGCVCSKDLSGNDELNVKQHSPTFLVTDELNVKLHSPTLGISLLEKLSIPGLM